MSIDTRGNLTKVYNNSTSEKYLEHRWKKKTLFDDCFDSLLCACVCVWFLCYINESHHRSQISLCVCVYWHLKLYIPWRLNRHAFSQCTGWWNTRNTNKQKNIMQCTECSTYILWCAWFVYYPRCWNIKTWSIYDLKYYWKKLRI